VDSPVSKPNGSTAGEVRIDAPLPARLARRIAAGLPGAASYARFTPELAYGRHAGPPGPGFRRAATLALCFARRHEWQVVLTLRPGHLPSHAGQVCFPGGELEPGETPEQAALRELSEELGIDTRRVTLLGRLSPIYIFASHFLVTPLVGWIDSPPDFHCDGNEVAKVLELPLARLALLDQPGLHTIDRRGLSFVAPHIECQGHRVWGATCMMLAELAALWRDVTGPN